MSICSLATARAMSRPASASAWRAAATIIAAELRDRNVASAQALFNGALGINYDNELFHMESFQPEYFGGAAYLYRVIAVE